MSCVPAYGDYSLTDNWYTLSEMKYNCTSNNPSIPIKVTNNEISFAKAYTDFNTDDNENLVFNKNDLLWTDTDECSNTISQMPYFNEVCQNNTPLPPAPKINSLDCSINTNTPNQECITPIKKVCPTSNTIINSEYPNACQKAYNTYDLNPSTNPLVIKDLNINQGIQNQITDNTTLTKIISSNNDVFANYYSNDYNLNNSTTYGEAINKILQETPKKLACCSVTQDKQNKPIIVEVRSPLSPNIGTNPQSIQDNKFGFQHRNLTIPPNTCPTYMYAGSDYCNAFMQTTCNNVQTVFNKNKNLNQSDFVNYAPECACYAPNTNTIFSKVPLNIPPMCYKDGCKIGNQSYIDPVSRAQGACNNSICTNLVQLSGITAGNSANINPILQNNCGSFIPASNNNVQNTNQNVSSTKQNAPNTSQNAPNTSQNAPSTNQNVSSTSQNVPSTSQNVPSTSQNVPSTSQNAPSTNQNSPTDNELYIKYGIYIIVGIVIIILLNLILYIFIK